MTNELSYSLQLTTISIGLARASDSSSDSQWRRTDLRSCSAGSAATASPVPAVSSRCSASVPVARSPLRLAPPKFVSGILIALGLPRSRRPGAHAVRHDRRRGDGALEERFLRGVERHRADRAVRGRRDRAWRSPASVSSRWTRSRVSNALFTPTEALGALLLGVVGAIGNLSLRRTQPAPTPAPR